MPHRDATLVCQRPPPRDIGARHRALGAEHKMAAPFSHLAPPTASSEELSPFVPDGAAFSLHIISAGISLPEPERSHLRGWKRLCDDLLPALRSRGYGQGNTH